MDEAESEKQRIMVTKSSPIKRKPLADRTNIVRKPNHTSSIIQSKKSGCSTASDSSIGSTQNLVNVPRPIVDPPDQPFPSKPHRLKPDHLAGEENQTAEARRQIAQNTRSKTNTAVPIYHTSFQGRRNNVKEESVSLCSSTLDKIKDLRCLGKMINDGKKISVAPHYTSTEKMDTRKSIDESLIAHNMKKANNSTNTPIPQSAVKRKDKEKENMVQSGHTLTGNANSSMGIAMPDPLVNRKDKRKAIAEPLDHPSKKKLKNNIMEVGVPLKTVIIKGRDGKVAGSSNADLAQKDKGKEVSTPINFHTLEKKDPQRSCPPILRTMSNRNDASRTEDVLQSKLRTEPPPNKKKKRCSAKEVEEEYTLPQEYVEQQRAYFKEIDDFELLVEEV